MTILLPAVDRSSLCRSHAKLSLPYRLILSTFGRKRMVYSMDTMDSKAESAYTATAAGIWHAFLPPLCDLMCTSVVWLQAPHSSRLTAVGQSHCPPSTSQPYQLAHLSRLRPVAWRDNCPLTQPKTSTRIGAGTGLGFSTRMWDLW
jgi:hypothetical protein